MLYQLFMLHGYRLYFFGLGQLNVYMHIGKGVHLTWEDAITLYGLCLLLLHITCRVHYIPEGVATGYESYIFRMGSRVCMTLHVYVLYRKEDCTTRIRLP
jgi:hypothetical protein